MSVFRNLLMASEPPAPTPIYTPVKYIQSSGTQYIDSGYYVNDSSVLYIDFVPLVANTGFELGSRNGNRVKEFTLFANYSSNFYVNYGDGWYITASAIPLNQRYQIKMGKSVGAQLSQDDFNTYTQKIAPFSDRTLNSDMTLGIFSSHDNSEGTKWGGKTSTKLYSVKIYENNVLIHNFIPVLDENNVPCLYDAKTQEFKYNLGTGVFTYETL